MATDASAALGAPQLAGSMVNPRGLARKMAGGAVGGLVGAAVGSIGSSGRQMGTPSFGRIGYLAVTANELALLNTKSGLWKQKIGSEVLGRRPRAEIASAEIKNGALTSTLTIHFTDGDSWTFDAPRANKKSATQIIQALNGAVS